MTRCPLCHSSLPPPSTLKHDPIHLLVPEHTEAVCKSKLVWLAELKEHEKALWNPAENKTRALRIQQQLTEQNETWKAEADLRN